MSKVPPELLAHREWLGQIGQVGLVVSANVLVKHGVFIDRQRALEAQAKLRELIPEDDEQARVFGVERIFREVLKWPVELLAGAEGGPSLPESLTVALPAYEDYLKPTYAVPSPEGSGWLLLIEVVKPGVDLDKAAPPDAEGWRASPQARFERLLRETGVGIGILINGVSLRLVYAPKGESSGYLTFTFRYLLETQGRPMAGALCALLDEERVSALGLESQRLPALLRESRKSQNDVSTDLAGQVLEALWELVRGFQQANDSTQGHLLGEALREDSRDVYGGMLTTLMRLVFILYAEDRSLMPAGEVYQRHYSVTGLFERLREDEARHPDTMDARYGAWAQLLALFRLIHDGGSHGALHFTARHGRLFDPDAYPFLEGRPHRTSRSMGERVAPPKVSDGVVYRVLHNLLILDGERLSYRTLDVEQIGSVYEAMMGFALEQATGPSIAVSPKHVVINLQDVLEQKPAERAKWLAEQAELKVKPEALAKAETTDDVVAALGKKVSRYTPQKLQVNALYLQPTEERRRSGSHYTPRSLTEPIVRTTFRPIFERLTDVATPEQILDLKVCDPAMGSGAFLVEACRLLGERLVKAWEVHKSTPTVPDDEDVLTYARRLVAERCLYGVDKNVFAVDLAKLSLWLATLAREHPFTFLDHSLRHGDSLVGLSREQIACFNWDIEEQMPLLRSLIDERVAEAQRVREQIQGLATSDDVPRKEHLLRDAEDAIADVRLIGDLVVSAFFERDKPKERKTLRSAYAGMVADWLGRDGAARRVELTAIADGLRENSRSISPFHWQIEFPEVFTRPNGGFDISVGNPPFAGVTGLARWSHLCYTDFLRDQNSGSGGKCDVVAFFFRRAFDMCRVSGAVGLLATNTVGQGDTRVSGLAAIVSGGGSLFEVIRRIEWPGKAAVVASFVALGKGGTITRRFLDGRPVDSINSYLLAAQVEEPVRIMAGVLGASKGVVPYGHGFVIDDSDEEAIKSSEVDGILAQAPDYADWIRLYLGAAELNSSPTLTPARRIVDLRGVEDPEQVPLLTQVLRRTVVPGRMALTNQSGAASLKQYWWLYQFEAEELAQACKGLSRVLVVARTAPWLAWAFVPAYWVFSEQVVVVPTERSQAFAVLQSRSHENWVRVFGSSFKDDPRYTPSRCFETFPFPDEWESLERLSAVADEYASHRSNMMLKSNVGLTELYGWFNSRDHQDQSIWKLRGLHDSLDRAVFLSYGWTDIQPRCEFILDYEDDEDDDSGKPSKKKKPYRYRWPDEIRDEVLGRLLELNATRAKEEARVGAASRATKPGRRKGGSTPLLGMLGDE